MALLQKETCPTPLVTVLRWNYNHYKDIADTCNVLSCALENIQWGQDLLVFTR